MTELLCLDDSYQTEFDAKVISQDGNMLVLDKTLFYATSGGQPGDTGKVIINGQEIPIQTTIKDRDNPGQIIHILPEGIALPDLSAEQDVHGHINWQWRHANMRMHTALHLLCTLIDGDVTGGQIGSAKSRLDFNIENGALDKETLTEQLNQLIQQDHPVTQEWITDEKLDANPEMIRTLSVKPPRGSGKVRLVRIGTADNTIDLQPCGGTHVRSTAEIGAVEVAKIENKGKMNKRVSIRFVETPAS